MPKILKNKNIMTRFPKMGSYPQGLGHTRTITWTYQDGGCGSWARNIPAANFVVALQRREEYCLSRQNEIIKTENINFKKGRVVMTWKRIYDIERSSKQ